MRTAYIHFVIVRLSVQVESLRLAVVKDARYQAVDADERCGIVPGLQSRSTGTPARSRAGSIAGRRLFGVGDVARDHRLHDGLDVDPLQFQADPAIRK